MSVVTSLDHFHSPLLVSFYLTFSLFVSGSYGYWLFAQIWVWYCVTLLWYFFILTWLTPILLLVLNSSAKPLVGNPWISIWKGIPLNVWLTLFTLSWVHYILFSSFFHFRYLNPYLGFWLTFLDLFWTIGSVFWFVLERRGWCFGYCHRFMVPSGRDAYEQINFPWQMGL